MINDGQLVLDATHLIFIIASLLIGWIVGRQRPDPPFLAEREGFAVAYVPVKLYEAVSRLAGSSHPVAVDSIIHFILGTAVTAAEQENMNESNTVLSND